MAEASSDRPAHLSRRHLFGGAGLLFLASACGVGSDTGSSKGSSSPGFPVSIDHKHGRTEIPDKPARVVTVGLTEQDYVMALGEVPVATREWFGDQPGALWPWARAELGNRPMPKVLPRSELDFEQIAALRPDVILGVNSGLTGQEYDKLSAIAPTVAQPRDFPDYGAPWQELTRTIGRALGKPEQADRIVRDLEGRFDEVRAAHPEFDGATGVLVTSIKGTAYVYATGPAPRFLTSLGFTLPPAAAKLFSGDSARAPVQVSLERLGVVEGDLLLLGVYGDPAGSIVHQPVYQQLSTVREGRDVVMPKMSRLNGALSFSSALSLPLVFDELVPRIVKAVDGDPATRVAPVA